MNAVEDATGMRCNTIPLLPEDLFAAMKANREERLAEVTGTQGP